MDLLLNMGMDIDDFSSSNVNNYNDVRGCILTFNKTASKTMSISLNKVLVDYATRLEYLNDIPDDVEYKNPINSSQLSYVEPKKIQVSRVTDYENRACLQ